MPFSSKDFSERVETHKIQAKRNHRIRSKNGKLIDVTMNRGLAIKAMCTECMGWEGDPKECTSIYCPLHPWRGKTLLAYKD